MGGGWAGKSQGVEEGQAHRWEQKPTLYPLAKTGAEEAYATADAMSPDGVGCAGALWPQGLHRAHQAHTSYSRSLETWPHDSQSLNA